MYKAISWVPYISVVSVKEETGFHFHFTTTVHSQYMMVSSYGNIFRVTGHLCGEFGGHRWIHRTKASDAELSWDYNRETGDLRRNRAHYDVIVIISRYLFSKELRKDRPIGRP